MFMVRQKTEISLRALEKRAASKSDSSTSRKLVRSTRKNTKHSRLGIMAAVLLALFILIWVTGTYSWSLKYFECGRAPVVVTSNFAGAGAKRLYPGDKNYGPGTFNHYECMLPEELQGKKYR